MTVPSEDYRSGPYTGNGVTTTFKYDFRIVDENHVRVIHGALDGTTTELVLGTDYTVTGVGDQDGGDIVLTAPLPSGEKVTHLRNAPFVQETDLENQGAYYAETVERSLDLSVMRDQQLAELMSRAVLVSATTPDYDQDALLNDIAAVKTQRSLAEDAADAAEAARDDVNASLATIPGIIEQAQQDAVDALEVVANGYLASGQAAVDAAEDARDEAISALSSIQSVNVSTAAFASSSYHPTIAPDFIIAQGAMTIGDGGQSSYKRNGTTGGDLVITTDGGASVGYTAIGRDVAATTFGASPNKVTAVDTQMAAAISAAALLGVPLHIPSGTYKFTKAVDFSPLIDGEISLGSRVIFDFTTATNAVNFPNYACVYVGGAALVALQDLNLDVLKGDHMLRFFSAAHGIKPDDRFCIYSSVLWNGIRSAYTSGEWVRALDTFSTDVDLYAGTYSAYAKGAIDLYKHPNKSIRIRGGRLTINESIAVGFEGVAGFKADRIVDSDFSAIQPTNSLYAGIVLNQCIGIFGQGYKVCQRDTVNGNSYGVVFSNCQDCLLEGYFYGGRHAVALGGLTAVGAVPNRNVYTIGTHQNSYNAGAGIGAWNSHGNSEFCGAEGTFDGGITAGGDHMRFRGRIRTRATQRAWAIWIVENLGFDFDFEGMEIEGTGDPSDLWSVGVVDCCAQSTSGNTAYTTRGGRINLNNVKFKVPDARILFSMSNQGYTTAEKISLSLQGASWEKTGASSPLVVWTQKKSGSRVLDQLYLHGFNNGPNATYSLDSLPLVSGWRASGKVSLTTSTSVNNVSGSAVFPKVAPKAPVVTPTLPDAMVGGEACVTFQGSAVTNNVTLGLQTVNPAHNFGSAITVVVHYSAALDEC